jgi:hypothetical protein
LVFCARLGVAASPNAAQAVKASAKLFNIFILYSLLHVLKHHPDGFWIATDRLGMFD